jgi:hypothetical protein
LIKHESFHEEREWRIYRHLDSGDSIRFYPGNKTLGPFVPIELSISSQKIESLKEVIVGPSDDHSTLQRWTTDFLRGLGCDLRVMVSGSPYRLRP